MAQRDQDGANAERPLHAAGWMFGALLSFSTMAVSVRNVSAELDTFQLMFCRSLLMLFFVLVLASMTPGGLGQFKTTRLRRHLARNSAHFVGQFGWFFGVATIPLAHVVAIEFTAPLWIGVFAPLLLREKLTAARGTVLFVGFSGVMVIVRPWESGLEPGAVAVMIAAVAFALTIIATKGLTRSESALSVLFYMGLLQAPMGMVPALWSWVWPSLETWFWLVPITVCGMSAHFCLTKALAEADALVVAPMDYLRLPAFAGVGFFVFGEALGIEVVLGGVLILLSNWINTWLENRRTKKSAN